VPKDSYIDWVGGFLKWLWYEKFPAVAAADYEDDLPNKGGCKSTLIPWPSNILRD
jgi:hypothetical protein